MGTTLEIKSPWAGTREVKLDINQYANNHCLYLGLSTVKGEPYGSITVNLEGKVPDYCGYVDTNNMPEIENFIKKYELGEFTGISEKSGFCSYPLYLFDVEKLRELCPEGMLKYEMNIGNGEQARNKKSEERGAR